MTEWAPAPAGPEPGRQLIGEWAVCGIAAAASRFIPIPLLDDAVRLRATQIAVVRTLRAAGRSYPSDLVEALYAGAEAGAAGRLREALHYLVTIPRRVLLFPVRKYVAVFGSVKGVPTDVMQVLLLGRTVYRCLGVGRLTGPERPDELARKALGREAVLIRRALDTSIDGMDLRLLTAALADGLSQGRNLGSAALRYTRRVFGRPNADPEAITPATDGEVEAGAEHIEEVLRRPEIARLLAKFDTRFDAELARLTR